LNIVSVQYIVQVLYALFTEYSIRIPVRMQQKYNIAFREAVTYGEYLLAAKPIELYPISGAFKFYHWKEMYEFEQQTGLDKVENIEPNFLGITLQSNWA